MAIDREMAEKEANAVRLICEETVTLFHRINQLLEDNADKSIDWNGDPKPGVGLGDETTVAELRGGGKGDEEEGGKESQNECRATMSPVRPGWARREEVHSRRSFEERGRWPRRLARPGRTMIPLHCFRDEESLVSGSVKQTLRPGVEFAISMPRWVQENLIIAVPIGSLSRDFSHY